jgi:hypothetical protein
VLLRFTGAVVVNAAGVSPPRHATIGAARTSDCTSRGKTFLVKLLIIGSKYSQIPGNPPSKIKSYRGSNELMLTSDQNPVITGCPKKTVL